MVLCTYLIHQPFDLTDLDWSPELLIAANDEDEQNSRLARLIWEDNGLDVPESFLQTMLKFLGGYCQTRLYHMTIVLTDDLGAEHDNAYVRSSTAAAFIECVEHWPQSITETLGALEDLYRAKVLAFFYHFVLIVISHAFK